MNRLFTSFVLFLSCPWIVPTSLAESSSSPSKTELISIINRNAKALSHITDQDSAENAKPELEAWRLSPFLSSDPAVVEVLESLIPESDELQKALAFNQEQLARIAGIDESLHDFVIVAMTGSQPIDVSKQFNALSEQLEMVTDAASLEPVIPALEELGAPLFPSPSHGVDDLRITLKHQVDLEANLRAAMEQLLKQIERIDQLDPALGLEVRRAINRPHALAMEEKEKRMPELRTRADAHAIKMAIITFFVEYRRYPVAPGDGDTVQSIDAKLLGVLSADDTSNNPRGIAFLSLRGQDGPRKGAYLDAWGNPLRVIIDTDYNNRLVIPRKNDDETILERVGVESAGPDGDFETVEDNVNSWEKIPE